MHKGLMSSRRFAPLFWSQFFGALNDNLVKNALAIMVMFGIAGLETESRATLVTLAGVMLILPFFLFSGLAGQIVDSMDKATVAKWVKGAEVIAALFALVGFLVGSVPLLMAVLFLTGSLSTLFGPVKYGILPDHLRRDELIAGNALVESGTFVAILLGTVVGGLLGSPSPWMAGALAVGVAIAAFLATLAMPSAPPRAENLRPSANILKSSMALLKDLRRDGTAWGASLAISWFWAVGAVVISLIPPIVAEHTGGSQTMATLFLSLFTVGIGCGSFLVARISGGRIVRTLVPIGAVAIGMFSIALSLALGADAVPGTASWMDYLTSAEGLPVCLTLFGLAAAGGLFVVPAFATLQDEAPEDRRARYVAANNVLNAIFMVVASVALMIAQKAGVPSRWTLAVLGIANLAVAPVVSRVIRASIARDVAWLLMRSLFRVRIEGLEHLPRDRRPRIMAANHVSLLDAVLILSVLGDDVVFAIDTQIARRWWVKPFLRFVKALPVDPTKPMAMRTMTALVKSGETLVIFPEGRITTTGALMKIYDGTAMVALRAEAELIPMWIDGLELSPFSYLSKDQAPRKLLPEVTLRIMPATDLKVPPGLVGRSRRRAAGRALQDVMVEARMASFDTSRTILKAVIDADRRFGGRRLAIEDPMGNRLTYRRLLTGAAALDRALGSSIDGDGPVGVMLPNGAGVVVTMLALMRRGKVPAMLNFSAGHANIASACRTARIGTVLTSSAFIEKARLERVIEELSGSVNLIMLEDVRARMAWMDKLVGFLTRRRHPTMDADAHGVILFTSGSEGTPKGVVLSHRNVLANCAQVTSRFDFSMRDSVFNALPVFHSFGLTGGLVLPLISGMRTFMYPSPLHYRIIPELVYQTQATAIFGTDVLLNGYARAAHPYDLSSVRYVVAGAERVRPETRAIWMEKFGLRILEGYGITEGAPVVAVNTPFDFRSGTVGRLVPGIEYRIEPVPGVDEGGRLLIRGPNIMKGYLLPELPGVIQPPTDGWHDTGDIVSVDEDGFLTIKGRTKRFVKIGGEMVSLAAVEAFVTAAWPQDAHVAVSVPDQKKGERIVLMTTRRELTRPDVQAAAKAAGATELMIPATILAVDRLPLLGSGKVDFVEARRMVLRLLEQGAEARPMAAQ